LPRIIPAYRQRKGYDQAIVTLRDAVTKRARDYWLGPYNTPQSRERYHRLIAEWEANQRMLPARAHESEDVTSGPTIVEVIAAYWQHAIVYYRTSECGVIKTALRILRQHYGTKCAGKFGPKCLRLVRGVMVAGNPDANPPRKPWSRKSVNKQIQRIISMFKWAAGQELLPSSVYEQLKTIEPLKYGHTAAPESQPVRPITLEQIESVRPLLSRQLQALIDLQLLTGARGGELFSLRGRDLDRGGSIWTYTLHEHKTAHRGKTRTIYFGPKAQDVLRPFLLRPDDICLFSPVEAVKERRQVRHAKRKVPMSCGNVPGSVVTEEPQRYPGDHYTKDSYARAIARACAEAFAPPEHLTRRKVKGNKGIRWETSIEWKTRLGPKQWQELRKWQRDHHWHPHQLRHTAATQIRRQFGLEAAQIALGHSSALVTEAVYAERDMQKVVEVMRQLG
jgi:integrase